MRLNPTEAVLVTIDDAVLDRGFTMPRSDIYVRVAVSKAL